MARLPIHVSAALLCLWAPVGVAADGEIECGRLSTRITERIADEKKGDFITHETGVYLGDEKDVPIVTAPTVGPPEVGCLRKSALMIRGGDPVEGILVVMVFPDGRYIGLWWDTQVEFHGGHATLQRPIYRHDEQDRERIPTEFRDLFEFGDTPK